MARTYRHRRFHSGKFKHCKFLDSAPSRRRTEHVTEEIWRRIAHEVFDRPCVAHLYKRQRWVREHWRCLPQGWSWTRGPNGHLYDALWEEATKTWPQGKRAPPFMPWISYSNRRDGLWFGHKAARANTREQLKDDRTWDDGFEGHFPDSSDYTDPYDWD